MNKQELIEHHRNEMKKHYELWKESGSKKQKKKHIRHKYILEGLEEGEEKINIATFNSEEILKRLRGEKHSCIIWDERGYFNNYKFCREEKELIRKGMLSRHLENKNDSLKKKNLILESENNLLKTILEQLLKIELIPKLNLSEDRLIW